MKKLFDFSKTKISLNRPFNSYTKVQFIYSSIIRGKKYQLRRIDSSKQYLNVGCGNKINPNFINLDYQWRPNLDLCWDITKGIPLKSNSVLGIFTEHCLEHILYSDCLKVLNEFYRILRPEGVVRIIVPDAELYLELYQRNKKGEIVSFPYVECSELKDELTPMMIINRVFRESEHLYVYDAQTLEMMLQKTGFKGIQKESYMHGRDQALLIDSLERKIESLYIEGIAIK